MPGKRFEHSLAEMFLEIAQKWAYDLNHPDIPENYSPRSG